MKKVISLVMIIAMVFALAVVASAEQEAFKITVIVKGEDSEFWQLVKKGAVAAEAELGDAAEITYQSVVNATDYDGQVALIQNVITERPDALVVSPNCEGSAEILNEAIEQGIKVIVLDTTYNFTDYDSFIVTDNYATGVAAADAIIGNLNDAGMPLSGSVCIISAKAGPDSLAARDLGFEERMAEIAPDIELLPTRYAEGDITKGIADTQDVYLANSDTLVGLYADANTTGVAIAMAVQEANLEGKFFVAATDSDAAELEALEAGSIHTLLIQDTYLIGYQGVMNAYKALNGEEIEKKIMPAIVPVTKDNVETEEIQRLLNND